MLCEKAYLTAIFLEILGETLNCLLENGNAMPFLGAVWFV